MKYYLIINPRSGGGRCGRQFPNALTFLEKGGYDFDYVTASTYAGLSALAGYAGRHGYNRVIAMGGDGTINAVINGLYSSHQRRAARPAFGVIYTGTSPDFCKSYGLPMKIMPALETITGNRVKRLRIGRIEMNQQDHGNTRVTRYFACCANIGLGASVAAGANRTRKYLGDVPGTMAALLRSIILFKPVQISAEIDGRKEDLDKVFNISVGRTKYIASGIRMPQGIADDDHRFYMLTASGISLFNLPTLLKEAYTGPKGSSPVLRLNYGKRISLSSSRPHLDVEFDGDPAGYLPCTIELAEEPLELLY